MAVPIWIKQAIDTWITAAKIEKDRLLRPLSKSGKMVGDELGDWAIWSVVEQSSKQLGSSTSALMTSAVPAQSFAARTEETWNRSNFFLGTAPFKLRSATSALNRKSPWP